VGLGGLVGLGRWGSCQSLASASIVSSGRWGSGRCSAVHRLTHYVRGWRSLFWSASIVSSGRWVSGCGCFKSVLFCPVVRLLFACCLGVRWLLGKWSCARGSVVVLGLMYCSFTLVVVFVLLFRSVFLLFFYRSSTVPLLFLYCFCSVVL